MKSAAELQRQIEALRERLSRLNEVSLRINEGLDFETVVQGVLDSTRALTGARYGVMSVVGESGQPEDFLSSAMTAEEAGRLWERPEGMRLFEYLGSLSAPLRLPDLLGHLSSVGLPGLSLPAGAGAEVPFLAAPILHQSRRLGNLFLAGKKAGEEFTREDEETLLLFTSQAAMVLSYARRYRDEQRARMDLETLIDTSPVGVMVLDARTGVPVSINREARRIVDGLRNPDQSAEELLQVLTFRRGDGQEISLEQISMAQALRDCETVRVEEIVLRVADGRSVTVLINATPICSEESGEVESVVVTMQDMTPLAEIGRLRAEFLAMVSHELRAPLTSIKGSTATVLGDTSALGAAEMVQFFRIINHQADHMSILIRDLLDVARIETGTLRVDPEPTSVAGLVNQARNTFLSGGISGDIRIELDPELPQVMADRGRMAQVLENLLSNAFRHAPKRGAPVLVSAVMEEYHVAISVTDRGRGVSSEQLPHLFRKVSRFDGEDGEGNGGAGLGLAICRGIVESHGGRIRAESEGEGRGTRITFTLPIVEEAATVAGGESEPGSPRRPGGQRPTRILVVDDDPQTLVSVRDALSKAGYGTIATGDPAEVPGLLEEHRPSLVLLDLVLPEVDGIDLMQDIFEMSGVPVLFLSAYGQHEVIARAFDAGAADYVVKPFSPTELTARIRAALRRGTAPSRTEPVEPCTLGDLTIDYVERRVTVGGRGVRLTDLEYRLLVELSIHLGRVVTYGELLERVWERRKPSDQRPLRSAVKSIRRKLGDNPRNPAYIFTEARVGYRMGRIE